MVNRLEEYRYGDPLTLHRTNIADHILAMKEDLDFTSYAFVVGNAPRTRIQFCEGDDDLSFTLADYGVIAMKYDSIRKRDAQDKVVISKKLDLFLDKRRHPDAGILRLSEYREGVYGMSMVYGTPDEDGTIELLDGQKANAHFKVNNTDHPSVLVYSASEKTLHWDSGVDPIVSLDEKTNMLSVSEDYDIKGFTFPLKTNIYTQLSDIASRLRNR